MNDAITTSTGKEVSRYLDVGHGTIPYWLIEDYEGAVDHVIDDMVSGKWQAMFGDKEIPDNLKYRADAEAKGAALFRLSDLDELRQEAILTLLRQSQNEGWYRDVTMGTQEYESASELIWEISGRELDRNRTGSFASNFNFILNELVPLFERMQIPPEVTIGMFAKRSKRKARESVTELRPLLKQYQAGGISLTDLKERIVTVLDQILNPEITVSKFLIERNKRMNKSIPSRYQSLSIDRDKVSAHYVGDKTYVLTMILTEQQLRVIEALLKGLVSDIPTRDIGQLFRLAADYLPFSRGYANPTDFEAMVAELIETERQAGFPTLERIKNGREAAEK